MTGKELIKLVDKYIDQGKDKELAKLVTENPNYAHIYIEHQTNLIAMSSMKIKRVALDLAYQLGK